MLEKENLNSHGFFFKLMLKIANTFHSTHPRSKFIFKSFPVFLNISHSFWKKFYLFYLFDMFISLIQSYTL